MRTLSSLLLGQVGLTIALPYSLEEAPKPTLGVFSYSGSGCPQGSVSFTTGLSTTNPAGNYTLTFGLDAFIVYYGPGTAPVDRSKSCAIEVGLSVPEGWKLRVNAGGTLVHGLANLDSGTQETFLAQYLIEPGESSAASIGRVTIKGPINNSVITKTAESTDGGYTSACGGGKVHANFRHSITTDNSRNGPGWETDELPWTLQTGLEVLKC
ncbi:uncharacterized protein EI97DRAFT_460425 [Westerdykella ornata]|uniref:Ubiquitin 3 binding protein But2 C-terminal domain-containing protein n=1 Tax=Westerdykella ornata TaxID=318751 RepID=A0A6A6JCM4_WESOR|nr:uncharacterized protein EI97DRAFT_460425 [Westerdykella ornata]KAF2274017.1 hypothetical protein EI97DRAFT_460425 [Westerdykella ornata]